MKKWIIIGVVAVGIVVLAVGARGFSLSNPWLDGEKEAIKRGDLVIPVSANGTVVANNITEVKCEASGKVASIHVLEGQLVREGDVLAELNPIDEQRNLEVRESEFARAKATLEKARINLSEQERTLPLATMAAKASLSDMEAQLISAEYDWKKTDALYNKRPPVASEQEWTRQKANFERIKANLERARADYETRLVAEETVLQGARQDVNLAQAALESAESQMKLQQKRVADTRVLAPATGMVYSVLVKVGEVIQSGSTSLTGGTRLMYLADTSKMIVEAQVDEADIGAVRKIAPEFARPGTVRRVPDEELFGAAPAANGAATNGSTVTPEDEAAAAQVASSLVGRPVRVSVEAFRNEAYDGFIERILPEPQNVNNVVTFKVRIVLRGDGLEKLLGLQGDVEFTAERVEDVLLVKNEAVYSRGKETYVYIPVQKEGSKRWDEEERLVRIGRTDGIFTEIVSGLTEKDKEIWTKRPRKTDREQEEAEAQDD